MLPIFSVLERCAITRRERIFKQLESAATLSQVSQLLKSKGVSYSAGSWDVMRDKRLLPAISDGIVSETDLTAILSEAEEHGHQHVFLYRAAKNFVAQTVNRSNLRSELKSLGREELLQAPAIVDEPHDITLTDARIDETPAGGTLVLKAVETVQYVKAVGGDIEEQNSRFFLRRYERVAERAVHVLAVHQNGLVELRVYAHDNSLSYSEKADSLWLFFGPIVDRFKCEDWSITKAQNTFWKGRRSEFSGKIKYGDTRVRDLSGNTASFASGGESKNLFDAPNATAGFDAFYGQDGTCDRSNLWFLAPKDQNGSGALGHDVHVRFSGAVNEFAVPASCTRKDYSYVLSQIIRANK